MTKDKKYKITDWAGNKHYGDKTFPTLADASGFLAADQHKRHPNATDAEFEAIINEFHIDEQDTH